MLQRAASNAYSWWWASHIRTKQSKWLDQSIQDMEEKVNETLVILRDEGDSFAKRAEMYYKKRPELVIFVEESFRAYRSLAEKYDHLSKELQSANRTIASVFPDQVPCQIDDDEEESDTGTYSPSPDPNINQNENENQNQNQNRASIPKVPKLPKKEFRSRSMLLSRKAPLRRTASSAKYVPSLLSSGLSKEEALAVIDKLQKEILALQTEKEFVRSLYERSYEKYWEIEEQITGMQKRVCSLQDEFGVGTVIEDNDARALMAATALKSCQETLDKLKEIQAQSSKEAKEEYQRVKKAHEMFETLRDQFISKYMSGDKSESEETDKRCIDEMDHLEVEEHDVGLLRQKIKQKLEEDSRNSLTVTEMAECIDELVNKVVTLETAVSSQTGLVKRLKSETDGLQTNIKKLEEDKEMLKEGSEVTNQKLKELEEELRRVKLLNRSIRSQDNTLQTHFTEASCNIEHISGKLNTMKPDEEEENLVLYKKEKAAADVGPVKKSEKHRHSLSVDNSDIKRIKQANSANVDNNRSNLSDRTFVKDRIQKLVQQDKGYQSDTVSNVDIESQDLETSEEDQPNWRQMFLSGLDDREKILLEEYTSVLVNYKDVRVKLNDVEKKNRDSIFELTLQLREMKNALVTRDKEINYLHQKLNIDGNPDESPDTVTTEYKYTPNEALLRKAGQGGNVPDPEISPSNLDANVAASPFTEQGETEKTGNSALSSVKMTLEKLMLNQDKRRDLSNLEQKFRSDIDDLLEENLEFWLRFSTSVHQIQKFQNSIQDLKAELKVIRDRSKKSEGPYTHSRQPPIQSQLKPIFRHLREIRTELSLWLEHNAVLQDELQGRYSSLCNIQDEIARAGNTESGGDAAELISKFQAAKFQGEILNMKQENSKVASELQAGLSLVKGMKDDVEKTLDELDEVIGINTVSISNKNNEQMKDSNEQMKHSSSRARIPLRSFLFGVKLKKQKHHPSPSLFACVNPTFQRQNSINDAPAPI